MIRKMATSPSSVRPFTLALLMLLLLGGVGCGDDGGSSVSVSEALADRGVDLDALFAAPTVTELDTMRRDWGTREAGADSVQVEAEFALEGGAILRVVSHRVDGQRHYGAVIIPPGQHLPASLPVAVSLIGFGIEMVLEVPDDARAFDDRYVTLLPSFRGHELRFGDETWVSEGDSFDQCDGGSDDALAFLEAALSTTPSARASDILAFNSLRTRAQTISSRISRVSSPTGLACSSMGSTSTSRRW